MAEAKKGRRITGVERERLTDELKTKYEQGASIRELAEQTGRSYGFVHRLLNESDTSLRGRGGSSKSRQS
jgi:transposase